MFRGVWWAAVHGVKKSWTWLGTHAYTCALAAQEAFCLRLCQVLLMLQSETSSSGNTNCPHVTALHEIKSGSHCLRTYLKLSSMSSPGPACKPDSFLMAWITILKFTPVILSAGAHFPNSFTWQMQISSLLLTGSLTDLHAKLVTFSPCYLSALRIVLSQYHTYSFIHSSVSPTKQGACHFCNPNH